MPIDDRTTNRSYQLPNASNQLADDVVRLRAALQAIDADVFARYTKTEVDTLINNLIAGAPGALNTLDELAAALGDDANFAATVTNLLALKANIADVYTKAEADARYVQGSVQTEMVFIATANQSVFTLTTAVINKPSALVTVDGVVQPTSEYTLNMTGTQLTLSEGVPVGTIVRVLALGVASQGAPADDTVTTPKLRDGAVTTPKLGNAAVTTEKLASGIEPVVASINGGPLAGARNRIINGDMRIDQRNGGGAITASPTPAYPVDRFYTYGAVTSKFTAQRNAGAVAPPAGFLRYLGITSSSAYTVGSVESYLIYHIVEGTGIADFGWGSASASPVTLSFWVRSSLTGTFSVAFRNQAQNRTYAATYTISSANTWEYKSITVPGDTTGTWVIDNTRGLDIIWNLGAGSAASTTANTWVNGNFVAATGAVSVVGTNGATFYITGVQLERGSVATPFEHRPLQELALCQRYYEKSYDVDTALATATTLGAWWSVNLNVTDFYDYGKCQFRVSKRASPTISMWSTNGLGGQWFNASSGGNAGNSGARHVGQNGCAFYSVNNAMSPTNAAVATHWVADAEL